MVEILNEGLSGSLRTTRNAQTLVSGKQVLSQGQRRKPTFNPSLDVPVHNDAMRENIQRQAGGSSVMANILADTAQTTYKTMVESDRQFAGGGDGGQSSSRLTQQEHIGDPEEVFGEEAANHWAELAFMNDKK
jgi:hypothetical protein